MIPPAAPDPRLPFRPLFCEARRKTMILMASWRERRAWRREFKSLGVRQVKDREAHSIWHEEKQREARRWLRERELLPYLITGLATIIAGLIAFAGRWLN